MIKKVGGLLFVLLWLTSSQAKVETSSEIFFPKQQARYFGIYQNTTLSWWNFLILKDESAKDTACDALNQMGDLLFNPCHDMPMATEWLSQWGFENSLLLPPPKNLNELENRLNQIMVQLSLPLPAALLTPMVQSPLAPYQNLKEQFGDFYSFDDQSKAEEVFAFWLPFPSHDSEKTTKLSETFAKLNNVESLGPHFGVHANQKQIKLDLHKVSKIAGFGILILVFLLWQTGQKVFLFLIPLLAITLSFSAFVVHWVWGSIHGLTLAFGSGLIGISMDYAFHGWRKIHDKLIWKSNLISFLTTLASFLLLSFFSVPLIRQVSLFAGLGLGLSFILSYLASKKLHNSLRPKEWNLEIPDLQPKPAMIIGGLIVALGFWGLPQEKSDFSLRQMDVTQSKQQATSTEKLFGKKEALGFALFEKDDMKALLSFNQWAVDNKVNSLSAKLPVQTLKEAQFNLRQWQKFVCTNEYKQWALRKKEPYSKIYKDFFNRYNCESLKDLDIKDLRKSWSLFESTDYYVSLLQVSDPILKESFAKQFPNHFFLEDITEKFPRILQEEIQWFLSIIAILSLAILSYFFGNKAPLALLPGLGGLSFMFAIHGLLGRPLTFISFVSMIILLGLSFDYGVFCTSQLLNRKKLSQVFPAIFLSATTSIIGFSPLAFCEHPVLKDMGTSIVFGLLGALAMSALIYPMLEVKKGKIT